MTGRISFRSKIVIPPGDRDIAEKLQLDGRFDIDAGRFSDPETQRKVASLSERARGDEEPEGSTPTASDLRGAFRMEGGVVSLKGLEFQVPGAAIRLNGTYGLATEELDFQGTATLQAKPSDMTGGVKSFFLKALDPFLHKKKVGTVVPIQVTGTRRQPSFGLNLKP
jgi:hypothetical protein